MATVRQIGLFALVELVEPVDAAPAGARGYVLHFLQDGTVAEIEIREPKLEGLDAIVYTTLDKLRVIKRHSDTKADSSS
jgi:hypothetical protein